MKSIEVMVIIISILSCLLLPVVPASSNSISYDQSHHSCSVFHNNFIKQKLIPTIATGNFVGRLNVSVPSSNIFFGVISSTAANTGTTIFRAVDAAEAASIKNTGQFLLKEGGAEVKYFAKSLEDAHWYGPKLYPNGYSVIESTVKGTLDLNKFWYPTVDIGAYIFPKEVLPYIIPK